MTTPPTTRRSTTSYRHGPQLTQARWPTTRDAPKRTRAETETAWRSVRISRRRINGSTARIVIHRDE